MPTETSQFSKKRGRKSKLSDERFRETWRILLVTMNRRDARFDCEQFREEARDRNLFQAVEDSGTMLLQVHSVRQYGLRPPKSSESHHSGRESQSSRRTPR